MSDTADLLSQHHYESKNLPHMWWVKFFWRVAIDESGCWLFTGFIDVHGYGLVRGNYKNYRAHRVSYELTKGPIPPGLLIDHICFTRACINPSHLRTATHALNSAHRQLDPTCREGHPYDQTNTQVFQLASGQARRTCRACRRAYREERRLAGLVY